MRPRLTETGAGDRAVVFVHGVLDTGRSFARVTELLRDECRMVTYDRRGYGASGDLPGVPAPIGVHIDDLVSILAGRRVVLVGHSFGGVIAAGAAVRAPDCVEALVLYESVMAWAPGWDDRPMRKILGSDDPAEAGLRMMLRHRYAQLSGEELVRLRREAQAFVAEEGSTRTGDPPYDVSTLRMPLVYGVSDTTPIAAMETFLCDVVPDVQVVRIHGGGHNAHRARPAEFADLVRLGLRRAETTAA